MIGTIEIAAVPAEADDGGAGGFGVAGEGEDDADTAIGGGVDFEFFDGEGFFVMREEFFGIEGDR